MSCFLKREARGRAATESVCASGHKDRSEATKLNRSEATKLNRSEATKSNRCEAPHCFNSNSNSELKIMLKIQTQLSKGSENLLKIQQI